MRGSLKNRKERGENKVDQKEWLEKVLKEEYHVVSRVKKTEKGEVLRLRHKQSGRDLMEKEFYGDGEAYRLLTQYQISGIPEVYEAISHDGQWLILEEWVDGITVAEILKQGLYKEAGARKLLSALCDSLSALHSIRIVHRDIKPENVMITNEGDVRLLDFDAARIYKPFQTKDTEVLGTVGYAAPEQFGFRQSDYRTDIYALGVLGNVMLTGEHPSVKLYHGKLGRVIETCIQTNPEKRFQSIEELKRKI